MIIKNENDLQNYIYNSGLQKAYKLNDIYVSKAGAVVSIKPAKNRGYKIKDVSITKGITVVITAIPFRLLFFFTSAPLTDIISAISGQIIPKILILYYVSFVHLCI